MRKNVDSLTESEVLALRSYLRQLEDDTSDLGFQVNLNPVNLELMIIFYLFFLTFFLNSVFCC